MVCEKVAKMTQMRHDNLANALRLVVSAATNRWRSSRYRVLASNNGIAECQGRGDIAAVLPQLQHLAVDVSWRMRLRSRTLLRLPRKPGGPRRGLNGPSGHCDDVPDHAAFRFVPLAVETCG